MDLQKILEFSKNTSTCQKRQVACVLLSQDGKVLSVGANKCSPPKKGCSRLGIVQAKFDYDTTSECNWEHSEIQAINKLSEVDKPFKAILLGHDFFCDACETALKEVGVQEFEVL